MKINKIVIVGGGSSGWMSAAALCKNFPDMDVTLIESKNIKTMGVGESTVQPINQYLDLIGLQDEDWMKECDATYKVSIRFTDFRERGSSFEYPFGDTGAQHMPRGHDCWPIIRQINPDSNPLEKFSEFYNPNTHLANFNKMFRNEDKSLPNFVFNEDTAYHFDAIKFGLFLKDKICKPAGINHIIGDVIDIIKKENGDIDYLISDSNEHLYADLFIDCTGFSSVLLEQSMGSKFISFNETLMNDRAIATQLPYSDPEVEMQNVTNCTAIENGWVWNIPLWSRIGSGYVYSSKFVDCDQAEVEFRNHLIAIGKGVSDEHEFQHINIRHGRRENVWVGNVLGVGLSYGFVEPLESTGLLTTHENIYKLIRLLQRRNRFVVGADKTLMNCHLGKVLDGVRSFIEMHYALSMRDDTEYWRYVTNLNYGNTGDMDQLELNVVKTANYNGVFGGLIYIAAGMGYLPTYKFGEGRGEISIQEQETMRNINKEFTMFSDSTKAYVKTLPSHYEFLKKNIYF